MKSLSINTLDKETFTLLEGKVWRNLQSDDLSYIPWFNDLDYSLHKYVLVSGESFMTEGKEGSEEFSTGDLIAEPLTVHNNPSNRLIILFTQDLKDAAILSEEVDHVGHWLESINNIANLQVRYGVHKVKSSA